jgi:uncharacterized membrane protein YhaH (DUF805 family)
MTLMHMLFGFDGRLRRRDYWLIAIGKFVAIMLIDLLAYAIFGGWNDVDAFGPAKGVQYLMMIPSFWISIAIALKRCHDRDKGGGWVAFFWLVPIVGWIWGFIELGFLDGTQGRNSYGKSPKGIGSPDPLAEVFA